MIFQDLPADRARECVERAEGHDLHDSAITYPAWYLKRWHFLPEGYLSRRSARGYDAIIRRVYYAASETQVRRTLVSAVGACQPASILDAGCGSGRVLASLARALPHARLVGVELSPFLLEMAAERLQRFGQRTELAHADVTELPFESGTFDAICVNHVLGHLPDGPAARAAEELRRVLAPGGRIFVTDHSWHPVRLGAMRRVARTPMALRLMHLDVYAERPDAAGVGAG